MDKVDGEILLVFGYFRPWGDLVKSGCARLRKERFVSGLGFLDRCGFRNVLRYSHRVKIRVK